MTSQEVSWDLFKSTSGNHTVNSFEHNLTCLNCIKRFKQFSSHVSTSLGVKKRETQNLGPDIIEFYISARN